MARKKKFKINPLVVKIIIGIVVTVSIGFFVYKIVYGFLVGSDYFNVKIISMDSSLQFINERDVSRIKGKNIFLIDLKKVEKRLEYRYPQIENLKVSRRFPNQILINAVKRLPLAQMTFDGRVLTIDAKGRLLSTKSRKESRLPLLEGIKDRNKTLQLGNLIKGSKIRFSLEIIKAFNNVKSLLSYKMERLDVSTLSKIEMILDHKLLIILDKDNMQKKMEVLGFVLSQGNLDFKEVKYIDLRFKEPIIGKK